MEEFIKNVLDSYNIPVASITKLNDTSKNDEDLRIQYLANNQYVVKLNTAKVISEKFLENISRLIERYNEIGVWAPRILRKQNGKIIVDIEKDGQIYHAYIEEYATYKTAEDIETPEDKDTLKRQIMEHIGVFAAKYSGVELIDVPSMWTIIDLHPLDDGVDEKQANLNRLEKALLEKNYAEEAEMLRAQNAIVRAELQKKYKLLPRCVYQGDLNFSNVLIDENNKFKGLIDFNMAGTEININNFLNETAYYLEEQDFVDLSAEEIHNKMERKQSELLDIILKNYSLNDEEKACMPLYKTIINMSLYPNVMLWIHMIRKNINTEKVLQLLKFICEK